MRKAKRNVIVILFILCAIDLGAIFLRGMEARYSIENAIFSILILSIVFIDFFIFKRSAKDVIKVVALFVSLVLISYIAMGGLSSSSINSTLRFSIPFFLFAISLDTNANLVKKWIIYLPFISLGIGVFLTIIGLYKFYQFEYTGAFRLQGAKMAAHFALLCVPSILFQIKDISIKYDRKSLCLLLATLFMLILTATRTPLAAIMLIGVVFVLRRTKKLFKYFVFLIPIFVIFLGVYGNKILSGIMERSVGEDGELNDSGRSIVWEIVYNKIKEYPVFGIGGGETTNLLISKDSVFRAPHNEYLHYTLDYGIIGFILILLFFSWNLTFIKNKEMKTFIIIVVIIISLTDNTLSTMAFQIPLFMMINLLSERTQKVPFLSKPNTFHRRRNYSSLNLY